MERAQVDVVVGGQYGDEGKGQVIANLLERVNYDVYVRAGAANAEHRFRDRREQFLASRVLPVGAYLDLKSTVLIPSSMVVSWEQLTGELRALYALGFSGEVIIDPSVVLTEQRDKETGISAASARGSTHLGIGAAHGKRVARDPDNPPLFLKERAGSAELKFPGLRISPVAPVMSSLLISPARVLVEGSQGALLSLHHGVWPWCTSRDVLPASALSDVGIPASFLRRVYAVFKTWPTRVPGSSGPARGAEVQWQAVLSCNECASHQFNPEQMRQTDSGHLERAFTWDWDEYEAAVALIGPTHLAFTHLDLLPGLTKHEYERLHRGCMFPLAGALARFLRKASTHAARVGHPASVAMLRYGPKYRDVLHA